MAQNQDNNNFYPGSPEVPGYSPSGEQSPQQEQVFSDEQLRRWESELQKAEKNREWKRQDDPSNAQQNDGSQPGQKPKKKQNDEFSPRYFGYSIPPQIANNMNAIAANAGKGNANDSKAWLYVFLDRLMKLRAA
ncbi:MAG TPA: hypothetical protein VGA67_00760 [Candidatus Dojkabacteria bacterium]|jgi:hypothetical protein